MNIGLNMGSIIGLFSGLLQIAACAATLSAAPATQPSHNPIRIWDETRQNPPLHLHFAAIDLRDPAVSVRVIRCGDDPDGSGPWQTTLATVSTVAERDDLDVAVNGNLFQAKETISFFGLKSYYFVGNWAMVSGWAMSDGRLWSVANADASLLVDDSGRVHIGRYSRIPEGTQQVVSGSAMLCAGGKNIAGGDDIAPRTAAGIDRDGRSLVLLVVDGRRPSYSLGMTLGQLADEMLRQGCTDALNLDGGGSSTLAVRDQITGKIRVANYPSDGHDLLIPLSFERPIADVLGIRWNPHSAPRELRKNR